MKSKVLTMFPYQQMDITHFRRSPEIDQAALQKELDRAVYPYITWSEGDTAAPGDVVTCRLVSSNARYNRPQVSLTVGAGLLDKEAESHLAGQKVGAELALVCRGSEVTATILSVKNRHVPAISDKMVAALGIEGVRTVAEYRTYLTKNALDELFLNEGYGAVQHVIKTVLERSEILVSEADWKQAVQWELGRLSVISEMQGLELKKMTEADFVGRIPVKSYYELVAMLQEDAWSNTQLALLGQKLAEEDGFAVTREGYETFLADTAASWSSTVEAYRPAYPFAYYEMLQYCNHYRSVVSGYIRNHIFEEE